MREGNLFKCWMGGESWVGRVAIGGCSNDLRSALHVCFASEAFVFSVDVKTAT